MAIVEVYIGPLDHIPVAFRDSLAIIPHHQFDDIGKFQIASVEGATLHARAGAVGRFIHASGDGGRRPLRANVTDRLGHEGILEIAASPASTGEVQLILRDITREVLVHLSVKVQLFAKSLLFQKNVKDGNVKPLR